MAEFGHIHSSHDFQPELSGRVMQKFRSQSQLDFELEFFDGILQRAPNYLDVLRVMANNLTAKGDYVRGLEIDRRVVRLCPTDEIAQYNLACSYSLLGLIDRALESLERALLIGYDDFAYLLEDRDLDAVRKDPRFRKLLETYGVI